MSLEGVAKAAGVGIGTLSRHFPTRDQGQRERAGRMLDLLLDGLRYRPECLG